MERQKLLWLLFFATIGINNLQAGVNPPPTSGARAISMGNAYTAIHQNFWSLFQNPAGIAGISQTSFGIYAERRFGLSELNYGHAGLALPFSKNQAIGATIASFGFDAYRESHTSLNYAISFMDRISIGARVNYGKIVIADFGSTSNLWVDIGLQTKINEKISLGFYVYNANRSGLQHNDGREDMPTVISSGIAYQPNEKVTVVADVQKDIDHPIAFKSGIEYQFIDGFYVRMGFETEPMAFSGGLGLARKNLLIDVAFSYQEALGYTPHLSLQYLI